MNKVTPLHILRPTQWEGKPRPERRWIVEGLIPRGAVTMLSGDGGLGKSLLTLQLLVAAATGGAWLGLDVAPCNGFGVYCEDEADELHRRLLDVCASNGTSLGELDGMSLLSRVGEANEFIVRDKYGKPKGPSVFYEQIRQTAKNTGSQLVIIDGLHDTFDGNENSRPEARAFVGMLRKIALETDGAVVLCAHPSLSGLNSGTGSSGSTAWNNAVRSRLYLTKPRDEAGEADPDVRVLKTVKANYGRSGDDIRIRWRNGAFVRDNVDAGGTVARIEDRNAEKAFLACLSALLAEGFDPSPAVEARGNYAPRLMRGRSEVRGFNERQLIKAMERLIAKGEVVQALTKR